MPPMLSIHMYVQSMPWSLSIPALFWRGCMSVCNVIIVCLFQLGVSETWNSKSCKCDCEGGDSPTEFPSVRTGSSMVRGVDCMPGMMTSVSWRSSRSAICFLLFLFFLRTEARNKVSTRPLTLERQQWVSCLLSVSQTKFWGFIKGLYTCKYDRVNIHM